jgi:hypothetical protein
MSFLTFIRSLFIVNTDEDVLDITHTHELRNPLHPLNVKGGF